MGYVPRFSIHTDFGGEEHTGEVSSLAVGYGVHQAWIFATLFSCSSIFGLEAASGGLWSSPLFISSIISNLATLFAFGFFDFRLLRFVVNKKTCLLAAAIESVGTLLVLLCGLDMCPAPLLVPAGVCTGVGSAVFIIFWGTAFARKDVLTIAVNTSLGAGLSALVYAFLLLLVPFPLSGLFVTALPWLECILVWKNTPQPYTERRMLPIFVTLPVNRARFAIMFALPMLLFGFSLGFVRERSVRYLFVHFDVATQLVATLGAGFAAVAAVLVCLKLMQSDRVDDLVRPLLPISAVAIGLLSATSFLDVWVAGVVILTGHFVLESALWMVMAVFAQKYRLSPVMVFGVGRGSIALGSLGSVFIMHQLYADGSISLFGGAEMVVICLVCLIAGLAMLPHEHDIRRAIKTVSSQNNQVVEEINKKFRSAAEAEGPDCENAVATGVSDCQSGQEADRSSDQRKGLFRKKCECVANQYLLSARENEVLFYLARGFNAAYLQEKLYISEGTAKTHIRHIYAKTNVHSQQELMRMVNDMQV
ncbi:hypothetical protein JI75_08360 [Berryella intestinalis]|uniref:HTH luxR-type domain-containing protein n=1 Tax=Berryella intestinalis TaxID=1531429 RepID=A0A0A8B593_9ACTN|nr:helix-turn-helix transcriptional regulator [Berryella intestinalis]AJC12656.1 hypothetical protein JI75_08360 [Berryella intestinalis]